MERKTGLVVMEEEGSPHRLLLRQRQSPGDVLALTAAVESLHRRYPGEYLTDFTGTCPEIWQNNPRITPLADDFRMIDCHYPAIHGCGRRHVSFMAAFCEYLGDQLGRPVPLLTNRPLLYLTESETYNRVADVDGLGPYVVLNAGRKDDYPAKWAGSWIWQQVVGKLRDRVAFVQVGEAHHHHPALDGVVNLIGKTTPRQLFQLVQHSVAAAGPVSFLLHVSAALGKPYVCVNGGREDPSWFAYSSTVCLHTLGQMDCCRDRGCWKSRVVPNGPGDGGVCSLPVLMPDGQTVPKCLELIGDKGIVTALEQILAAAGI